MPRIRQYAQQYADSDFWKEIQSQKALRGIRTDKELAQELGLSSQGLSRRKQAPEMMTVGDLRQVVKTLKPSCMIVLKMLGYSRKEILRDLKMEETN